MIIGKRILTENLKSMLTTVKIITFLDESYCFYNNVFIFAEKHFWVKKVLKKLHKVPFANWILNTGVTEKR